VAGRSDVTRSTTGGRRDITQENPMKLTVHTFLTLDGVMQGPGGADEDRSGGFGRGGWLVPLADAGMGEIVESWFARADAILLGRNTYDTMRAYWSQVTDPDNAAATRLNYGRKYVASNTLTDADWGDTTVLGGDVIAGVTDLKKQSGQGELQVHGSARLAQSLHRAGLIDEYRLLVFPVTVGAGKRLFTEDAPAMGYTLLESRVTGTGAQYQVLAPKAFQAGGLTVQEGREAVL
jgi:dihydrofolate reductase